MAARETKPNGKSQLIRDLKNGEFATLYIISGEESYMKEYYLRQLRQKVVDETFADFNLIEFEGKGLTPEMLTEAIDSYPAMADKSSSSSGLRPVQAACRFRRRAAERTW
ncbi:MAG: hypothetical protein ACLUDF_06675 [Butyricicoccus sp.]